MFRRSLALFGAAGLCMVEGARFLMSEESSFKEESLTLASSSASWEAQPVTLKAIKKVQEKVEAQMYSKDQRLSPDNVLALYRLAHVMGGILDRHEVAWWATSGTILGVIRNKGIIPHDDDLDFNFLDVQADIVKAPGFLKDLEKNGLKIHNIHQEFWQVQYVNQTGPKGSPLHVDLFALLNQDHNPFGIGDPNADKAAFHYGNDWWPRHTFPASLCSVDDTKQTVDGLPVTKCRLQRWPFGVGFLWAPEEKISVQYLDDVYGDGKTGSKKWREAARCEDTNHPCGLVSNTTWDATGMAEPSGPLFDAVF